jgi:hypothetical protein
MLLGTDIMGPEEFKLDFANESATIGAPAASRYQ